MNKKYLKIYVFFFFYKEHIEIFIDNDGIYIQEIIINTFDKEALISIYFLCNTINSYIIFILLFIFGIKIYNNNILNIRIFILNNACKIFVFI